MDSPTFAINLVMHFEKEHGKSHDKYIHSHKVYEALIIELHRIDAFILTKHGHIDWKSKYGNTILIGINSGTFIYIIHSIEIYIQSLYYVMGQSFFYTYLYVIKITNKISQSYSLNF